jgi:hypothetical protein
MRLNLYNLEAKEGRDFRKGLSQDFCRLYQIATES